MKINVDFFDQPTELQLFDCLYAYRQSLQHDNQSDWQIQYNSQHKEDVDLDILLLDVFAPRPTVDFASYDLILLLNRSEPLEVFNQQCLDLLELEQTYIIANSFLSSDHTLHGRVLWFPYTSIIHCIDWWHRSFFPMAYQHVQNSQLTRQDQIVAINGANRANRNYFFALLSQSNCDIKILSNINSSVNKLRDACWESEQDTEFKIWLNSMYQGKFSSNSQTKIKYYDSAVSIGIDKKFGSIPPGYWLMPEYYENICVVFPESCWLNGELSITEKSAKCFLASSMPFPIAGSDVNQLYNRLGFWTAWNLLPMNLQGFDSEKNHALRYQGAVDAIAWLNANKDVFATETCKNMLLQNKLNFVSNTMSSAVMEKICSVLENRTRLVCKNVTLDHSQDLI